MTKRESGLLKEDDVVTPVEATEEDLLVVHSSGYLNSLKWSMVVAGITEVPPVALLPNFIVQRKLLKPLRLQTGGTVMAGKLATERGWALNIGGGFHHCSAERGGGFCAYADITLSIKGNGHERDFISDSRVYIMDVYNRYIYPHDSYAKGAIRCKVELQAYTEDDRYLSLVRKNLEKALEEFNPDIIVYNAGTDVLEGDPLGALSISPEGIVQRDQLVFELARGKGRPRQIPILMVTSGGYQKRTAQIIADSIKNLIAKGLISHQAAAVETEI
ncbi:HDAC11 [Branchiostoma lanceolatum]|uniref:HDAC11 protein n=1 Tax=Branchiostoma lanceolatum TaxID=7740 RepID=A0A8K0A161_BRALA|nr:HDAC11 [Branchiostoma lanceolatum]